MDKSKRTAFETAFVESLTAALNNVNKGYNWADNDKSTQLLSEAKRNIEDCFYWVDKNKLNVAIESIKFAFDDVHEVYLLTDDIDCYELVECTSDAVDDLKHAYFYLTNLLNWKEV